MSNEAKRLKSTVAIVVALAIPLSLSACSRFGGQPEAAGTLTLWTQGDSVVEEDFVEALAGFTEETGIEVAVTVYQNDQFKQNIANATGTSAMPDVFANWSGMGLLGNIYDAGAILPLDEYYEEYGWDGRFNAAALTLDVVDGELIGVPWIINEMAVVYKKSTLENAGITEVPTTYAELLDANEKLLAAGVTPWSFAGKNSWNLMRLTDSLLETKCGATDFDALRNLEADWTTTPCAVEGFAELTDWIDKGYLTENFMALDPNARTQYEPIYAGTAAFTIDGNWSGPQLAADGQDPDEFAFFPFPTDTERLSYFTNSWYINSGSTDPDGAARLLDYLTDRSVIEKYPGISVGAISGTDGVAPPADSSSFDLAWFDLTQQFQAVYLPSDQAFVPEISQSFLRNQDRLTLGQQDASGTVQAIQADIDVYQGQN